MLSPEVARTTTSSATCSGHSIEKWVIGGTIFFAANDHNRLQQTEESIYINTHDNLLPGLWLCPHQAKDRYVVCFIQFYVIILTP